MVKAIETTYAGCRFRSRLEARWAVFFDALGVQWQYEPEGVEVTHRLSSREGTFAYLPDFWLPGESLWVEVKGSLTGDECLRLLDAAAHLSSGGCGGCNQEGADVLVMGPFVGGVQNWPLRLHMHKGDVIMSPWNPAIMNCPSGQIIASDFGGDVLADVTHGAGSSLPRVLLAGSAVVSLSQGQRHALAAARGARFEHGQSGAVA